MYAIFVKEFKSYFHTLTGYIFLGTFLLFFGLLFALLNLYGANNDYNGVINNFIFVLLFIIPILTMKIISEETRSKTDQLLLTSPVKLMYIVVGKYLGALALFLVALLITCLYPAILYIFGPVTFSEVFVAYVGLFLLGSSFIAIGVFISSLTENQFVSAVITFGALLFIWILDSIMQALPVTRISGITFALLLAAIFSIILYLAVKNVYVGVGGFLCSGLIILCIYMFKIELFDGLILKFFGWFSLLKRFDKFSMGVLSINSIVYYLTFIIAFIFLTIRILEKRRWS